MNKELQERQILNFLKGRLKKNADAFTIYQWIDRCYAEGWWELATALGSLVPPGSLPEEYHRRLDYLLVQCRRNKKEEITVSATKKADSIVVPLTQKTKAYHRSQNTKIKVVINWQSVGQNLKREVFENDKAVNVFLQVLERIIIRVGRHRLNDLLHFRVNRGMLLSTSQTRYHRSPFLGYYLLVYNSTAEKKQILHSVIEYFGLPSDFLEISIVPDEFCLQQPIMDINRKQTLRELILERSKIIGIDPFEQAFKPSDLGIRASDYGSFSDYCGSEETESGKWNNEVILKVAERTSTGQPFKYLLTSDGPFLSGNITSDQFDKPHSGNLELKHSFEDAWEYVDNEGSVELSTSTGHDFETRAGISGEDRLVIRFFHNDREYGRAYECCWGHYYNCNRTRIGMYLRALDEHMTAGQNR